jgi:hypothetical protein
MKCYRGPDLFDSDEAAYARGTDPDTSHAAARQVDITKREAQVWDALVHAHPRGLTTHEIVDLTRIPAGSVTPRMARLCEKGWAIRSNERRIPPGHYSPQTVWYAVLPTGRPVGAAPVELVQTT